MTRRGKVAVSTVALIVAAGIALVCATRSSCRPIPDSLPPTGADVRRPRVLDRHGEPLSVTFDNRWNVHDTVALHEVPRLLRDAFVMAEDHRFFRHRGPDWVARLHAAVQNIRALRSVRGASTISEQAVRMLHGRPRTLWTRWVEGFEAARLERRFTKGEILEFYLNQVPFSGRLRGVMQASQHYFDRDLDTLSAKEILALAVLVRSPGRLDPRRGGGVIEAGIVRLAERMYRKGMISDEELREIRTTRLDLHPGMLAVDAPHFVRHVRDATGADAGLRIRTTLDGSLQRRVQAILEGQIEAIAHRAVTDGAVLVADHRTDEILAWVNAGGFSADEEGSQIDAVLALRQPGSTLKPFLYALALARGWTAATLVEDSPLAMPVGGGLHRFRNYSRLHHGPLRVRVALGNSLNVPAVRTIHEVTPERFHDKLQALGFASLDKHPLYYGEGLALGNGEVSLLELVEAYATLGRGGVWRPLRFIFDGPAVNREHARRVFSSEVSSIIADILWDPDARSIEFGRHGVLDLPVPTAVKTGTSNDYRDAWAVGFSSRFTVGVWMGNLDGREMQGVSGSIGPGWVLRAVFAELRREHDEEPLTLDRRLIKRPICAVSGGVPGPSCPVVEEWFRPGNEPEDRCSKHPPAGSTATLPGPSVGSPASTRRPIAPAFRLSRPTPGLQLAMDPRIPDELEAFSLEIENTRNVHEIVWYIDDRPVGKTGVGKGSLPWALQRGEHVAHARVWPVGSDTPIETPEIAFNVK